MKMVIKDLTKFKSGVSDAVATIASTYGYYGRGVLIDVGGQPLVTRDGAMVSNHLAVADPVEALAARMVKDGSLSTYSVAGDGTTTCAVLIGAMVDSGYAAIEGGENCYDYIERLGVSVATVLEILEDGSDEVESLEQMVQVATVSSNNDVEMGTLIGEMAWKLGVYGTAQFDEGMGDETEVDVIEGYFTEGGVFDRELNRGKIEVSSPKIFLCSQKLDMTEDLSGLFKAYWDEEKAQKGILPSLVIVVPDVTQSVLANLRATVLSLRKVNPAYNILFIRAPSAEAMDDLAFLLDTKVYGQRHGRSLKKIDPNRFGTCKRVKVDQLGSVFFHDKDAANINEYVEDNNIEGERMSRLRTGIGLIRVGGATGVERSNTRLMLDDTYKTCFAALRDGIIKGGGYGLMDAGAGTEHLGVFTAPLRTLLGNKYEEGEVTKRVNGYINDGTMLDLKSGENFTDHKKVGLYDSVRATSSAVKNAYSVASQILSIKRIIT